MRNIDLLHNFALMQAILHIPKRRVIIVTWKGENKSTEVFSSLKNFCLSYTQYNYHSLTNHLSKTDKSYENETIKIERAPVFTKPKGVVAKPDFYKALFWDFDYDKINWQQSYRTVIERVLERGTQAERDELLRYYGKEKVISTLMNEIKYLPDYTINDVCSYFGLKKEDMVCYVRMQSRKEHWT